MGGNLFEEDDKHNIDALNCFYKKREREIEIINKIINELKEQENCNTCSIRELIVSYEKTKRQFELDMHSCEMSLVKLQPEGNVSPYMGNYNQVMQDEVSGVEEQEGELEEPEPEANNKCCIVM